MRAPLAVMMLDLDGLKLINDTHGHPVGAHTIAEVGKLIGRSCRADTGAACRFGGDEFAAFLPGLGKRDGAKVGETIRSLVSGHRFEKDGVVVRPDHQHRRLRLSRRRRHGRPAPAPGRRGALSRQEDRPRPGQHVSERARAVRATVDESRWPRVYVTWPGEALADEEFEALVAEMSAFAERGQPYAIIHDARRAVRPTPKQRAFAAGVQKRDTDRTRRWLRGVAMVVSSPLIASVVTAINWITPPPYPQKIFSSLQRRGDVGDPAARRGRRQVGRTSRRRVISCAAMKRILVALLVFPALALAVAIGCNGAPQGNGVTCMTLVDGGTSDGGCFFPRDGGRRAHACGDVQRVLRHHRRGGAEPRLSDERQRPAAGNRAGDGDADRLRARVLERARLQRRQGAGLRRGAGDGGRPGQPAGDRRGDRRARPGHAARLRRRRCQGLLDPAGQRLPAAARATTGSTGAPTIRSTAATTAPPAASAATACAGRRATRSPACRRTRRWWCA